MIRSTAFPVRVFAAAFAVAALAGCVKKQPTEVNPSYAPEGTLTSQAKLVVYPDQPTTLYTYFDKNPDPNVANPIGDSLVSTAEQRVGPAGTLRLMLFDGTQASAFELLRREAGGGFFRVNDFLIHPARKWIDGQREVYVASDPSPSSFTPATYQMRGVVGGAITSESPLTNTAIASVPTVQPLIITSPLPSPSTGRRPVSDSLFTVTWAPVTGAAGYWMQVYQFLEANRDAQIKSGVPAPAYVEKERDFFLGYIPAPATSYKLGTSPPGVEIYTRRLTLRGQVYLVRISAVDADGALIAHTVGDFGTIPGEGLLYTLFPLGAASVDVQSGLAPQTGGRAAASSDLPALGAAR